MIHKKTIIILYLLLLLTACQAKVNSVKEDAFSKIAPIPINEMNKDITIALPLMDNKVYIPKIGELVTLAIYNHSSNLIKFPSDYGIKMYIYNDTDDSWTGIKNLSNYYPIGNPQISPEGDESLGQILIMVKPDLPDATTTVNMRVVISGTIYQNDKPTNKLVGAYTDITIQP